MVKRFSEDTALAFDSPIPNRLVNQKMKKRIVSSRDGPAKTRLFGITALPSSQMIGLLQQVVRECHSL